MERTHWQQVGEDHLQRVADVLKRYVTKWIPVLGLESWDLTIDYHLAPFDEGSAVYQAGKARVAWKYKDATVSFYLASLTEANEPRLEYVVVHELCHVLLNQMRGSMRWSDDDMANEERVVTETAKALIRARCWEYEQ